jgi:hypothetical protein
MTKPSAALGRAFDDAKFGFARTLDLRTSMPTGDEATRRADSWLRERQVANAGDVLVITGRGNGSPGGVGVVREAMLRLFRKLKRLGVVSSVAEHTSGSFVVTLASVRALFETMPRSRGPQPTALVTNPSELAALDPTTLGALRRLAEMSIETLGAPCTDAFVRDEMLRQFSILSAAMTPDETDRGGQLQLLISAALRAFERLD